MYPCILNLGARWSRMVNFTPWQLYPWGKCPGTPKKGDWVGPRASLDPVVKRKIPDPAKN